MHDANNAIIILFITIYCQKGHKTLDVITSGRNRYIVDLIPAEKFHGIGLRPLCGSRIFPADFRTCGIDPGGLSCLRVFNIDKTDVGNRPLARVETLMTDRSCLFTATLSRLRIVDYHLRPCPSCRTGGKPYISALWHW